MSLHDHYVREMAAREDEAWRRRLADLLPAFGHNLGNAKICTFRQLGKSNLVRAFAEAEAVRTAMDRVSLHGTRWLCWAYP